MNIRKVFIALIVIVFLGGWFWYYRSATNVAPVSETPFVSPTSSATNGVMQLPTSLPFVTPPTTPPPSVGGASKPVVTTSGIRGSVFIGPTCPVQRMPPDPNCADRAYVAKLVAKDKSGAVVKTFSSNSNGVFEVTLPAGTYSVGPAPSTSFLPRAGFQDVVVKPNAFTTITIQFDSGIR